MNNSNMLVSRQRYDELYHHGILGMKWGIRRFQNPDGTLTEEGRKRYNTEGKLTEYGKQMRKQERNARIKRGAKIAGKALAVVGGLTLGVVAADLGVGVYNTVNNYPLLTKSFGSITGELVNTVLGNTASALTNKTYR